MLNVTKAAEALHLSPETMIAQEALRQAMKMVRFVYTNDFRNLHETHELQGGKGVGESIDMLPCDPPYNFCCQQDLQNSCEEVFDANEMEKHCYFAEYVLNRGGRGHIFCSSVQFASCRPRFCACTEEVGDGVGENEVFKVVQTSFLYGLEYGNDMQDPQLNTCGTITRWNKQFSFGVIKYSSSSCLHACSTTCPAT